MNEKVCFLAFSHFKYFIVTHGHIPAIFNFVDLILSELSLSQSPQHSKIYLQSWKPNQKLILYCGKVKETYFTLFKKANILVFKPWSKNLFNAVRLRLVRMLARPPMYPLKLKLSTVENDVLKKLCSIWLLCGQAATR